MMECRFKELGSCHQDAPLIKDWDVVVRCLALRLAFCIHHDLPIVDEMIDPETGEPVKLPEVLICPKSGDEV